MRNFIKVLLIVSFVLACVCTTADAESRLKDVARIQGNQEVFIVGTGLVIGLNGTGDGKNTQFTIRALGNYMKRMGITVDATRIKVDNVAMVSVTSRVSPFFKKGDSFDIIVSSIGDANSLQGGTLLATSLVSPSTGKIYATGQGPVSIGGLNVDYGGRGIQLDNYELVGRVPGGGILTADLPQAPSIEKQLHVSLFSPDYTTAARLARSIDEVFGRKVARPIDAGNIIVDVPEQYLESDKYFDFISKMERVTFQPDNAAKVVINEKTGTVIAGGNVVLLEVAISHGGLNVTIQGIQSRIISLWESTSVSELVTVLNHIGATPRDLIAIFQALKRSGALQAELIVM